MAKDVDVPLMHERRTGYVSLMTKEDWEADQNKVNVAAIADKKAESCQS
ncbi:MAG: hypothetical protein IJU93_09970 [Lachnospiraceae bacterium]|nr:hypothetical protein [Lachnospiraceae bacterium]